MEGDSTIYRFLKSAIQRHASHIAVRDTERSVTYQELGDEVARAVTGLYRLGVSSGDRVVFAGNDSVSTVVHLFACARIGAVSVTLGPYYSDGQLEGILADCRPRVVVGRGRSSSAAIPSAESVPVTDGGRSTPSIEVSSDDIAALIYTSGTTGRPRGVVCRHGAMCFAVDAISARLGYRENDTVYVAVPAAFDYGQYQFYLAARAGALAHIAVSEPLTLASIARSEATILPILPGLAATLARRSHGKRATVDSVRLITNTGGHLGGGLRRVLRDCFPSAGIVPMYGLTECKRATIADVDEDLVRPNSVGHALPGTTVTVRAADGRVAPEGALGEVVVDGPNVMAGYWHDLTATHERFRPDATGRVVLWTGDYGRFTSAGGLEILGRRDDQLKVHGIRVSAAELERAAMEHASITAARAIRDGDGEAVLFVESDGELADFTGHLVERLGAWKVPSVIRVIGELPRTSRHKVDDSVLKRQLRV